MDPFKVLSGGATCWAAGAAGAAEGEPMPQPAGSLWRLVAAGFCCTCWMRCMSWGDRAGCCLSRLPPRLFACRRRMASLTTPQGNRSTQASRVVRLNVGCRAFERRHQTSPVGFLAAICHARSGAVTLRSWMPPAWTCPSGCCGCLAGLSLAHPC